MKKAARRPYVCAHRTAKLRGLNLAALLYRRHSGSEQYFCRPRLLSPGRMQSQYFNWAQ
jgi:hypothetical protein